MKRTKFNKKKKNCPDGAITPEVVQTKISPTFKGYYEDWMVPVAEKLVGRLGARIEDLADFFGVHYDTITNWQNTHPEFNQAIRSAKVRAAGKVANALYNRAIGMTVPDTQFFAYKGEIVCQTYEKHLPPDAFAAKQWLSTVMRELWADNNIRVDVNHTGTITHRKIEEIPIQELTKEQRELIFQLNIKQLSQPGQN